MGKSFQEEMPSSLRMKAIYQSAKEKTLRY
jgi:hypothetical protein